LSLCSALLDGFREVTGRLSAESCSCARHGARACTTRKEHVSLVDASNAIDDAKIKTIDRSIGKQAIDALSLLANLAPFDAHHDQP